MFLIIPITVIGNLLMNIIIIIFTDYRNTYIINIPIVSSKIKFYNLSIQTENMTLK